MKKFFQTLISSALLISLALVLTYCSGGGGGGGEGGTTISTLTQAAATSSAAAGAAALTTVTVGAATSSAKGAIPGPYIVGQASSQAIDTSAIADIDPRLKNTVDKMVAQLQKPVVNNAILKANTLHTASAAPTAAPTTALCSGGGSFTVTASISTSGTTTAYTLTATFVGCKDNTTFDMLDGSLSATHVINSAAQSETANVTATSLTDTEYTDITFTTIKDTLVLNGTFDSVSNNGGDGTNSANGTFAVTNSSGTFIFSFNNISDVWTKITNSPGAGDLTTTHKGNGSFGFAITNQTGGSVALTITLTNLMDKLITYFGGAKDEWINGGVTIGWTPDISQWGCLNGTYNFSTADGTPIHTPAIGGCPTSGTLQVNNATIQYGVPLGTHVTVTINGISKIFPDCTYLGGGMCR